MKTKIDHSVSSILSLGKQPVSNRFLACKSSAAPFFDLSFVWDESLGCMALANKFPVSEIKPRFEWITCFEPEEHLDHMVDQIIEICGVSKHTKIVGYSFKDDSTLARIVDKTGAIGWRLDPISDFGLADKLASVESFQEAFTREKSEKIALENGKSDLVIARHVVEHSYDIPSFINGLKNLIHDSGFLAFELPNCENAMTNGDCTVLWEEHTAYFTRNSFRELMNKNGLDIIFEDEYEYPLENSILMVVKKSSTKPSFDQIYSADKELFETFAKKVEVRKTMVREKLLALRQRHGRISIFGAGHLAISFISFNQIEDLIDVCFDDNPHKNGMFLPIGKIPIVSSKNLTSDQYPVCLLGLNPQHHHKIRKNFTDYLDANGRMISIFSSTDNNLDDLY